MKTLATGLLVLLSVFVAESSIAQQGINAPPDAIFYNGKIITVDSGFTIAQAFAVHLHERTVGKLLRKLSFRRVSVRPQHPQSKPEEQAVFSAALPIS